VPKHVPVAAGDRAGFSAFVRAGFASRRKTLRNNVRAAGSAIAPALRRGEVLAGALEALGIRADVRAEALAPEELAAVYEALKQA
jgi:16S rRNA A1518/A1519 N6-dimethyltransferase RsmA/KsgA/DIM1 with predicted DNA glycosylase/AP lyase activity